MITKDLPISPRCTPYVFYRGASSAILQLVHQWLNFTCSRSHAFRYLLDHLWLRRNLSALMLRTLVVGRRQQSKSIEAALDMEYGGLMNCFDMLRMASVARVDRRLRRYYLIVRLLPNVFALACRSLGSIYYDTGSPQDGKTPFGWLHPCRLVTDSRRYLIVGASAAMPLYSSFIFSLNNRASTIS